MTTWTAVAAAGMLSLACLNAHGDYPEINDVRPAVADTTPPKRRVALVLGVDVAPTQHATNGATAVAERLAQMGYEVEAANNPGRERIRQMLATFGAKARTAHLALFYFGGHGLQIADTNYLVPHGAVVSDLSEVEANTVSTKELYDALRRSADTAKVVVLDACRLNPFSGVPLPPGLAAPALAPDRTFVAYAAAPGDLAGDGGSESRLTPFTAALVRHLPAPGGRVEEVFKRVRSDVKDLTHSQQPWDNSALLTEATLHDPVAVEVELEDGDDEVVVVAGAQMLAWQNPQLRKATLMLPAGDTPVRVWVYNQHTFAGHNAWFGAPEGWRYRMSIRRPDGSLVGRFASAEDEPEKDGPRHGKAFAVACMALHVEGVTRTVGLVGIDTGVWRR